MFTIMRSSCLLTLLILTASFASAQQQTGTPPFTSAGGGPDIIDLSNLNAHLTIPVLHKPGRGTNFRYDLTYDSSIWYPVTSGSTTTWQPVINWGWNGITPSTTGYATYTSRATHCRFFMETQWITEYYTAYAFAKYVDSFGISHTMAVGEIQDGGAPDCGPPTTATGMTTDGSGYTFYIIGCCDSGPDAEVFTKDGAASWLPLQGPGGGTLTDRNGNEISLSGGAFTDTLGTTALTVSGSGTPASPTKFTYTDSSGTSRYYQANYTNYTVATNFGAGISEYKSSAAVALITSIVLPDGSQYTFAYEPTPSVPSSGACTPYSGTTCVTARLKSVTLPTGGSITYNYTGGYNGINTDGSPATLARTLSDGGSWNATWTYAHSLVSGTQYQTIVTDPTSAQNQTSIQFQGIYETQRKIYQGLTSGTLLQTINTCYNAATSPCTTTAITLPISQITTLATVPGSGNLIAQHTDKIDSLGDTKESDDYDFATGAPYPLLRQILITYATINGNLTSFPQTVVVNDGSGNAKSRQVATYDQYGSGLVCVTAATQHDNTNFGCSFTARGNATSVTTYTDPVTPSGAITKNFTFNSLGNMLTAQLNCCQLKTWVYSSATNFALPDTVTSGSSAPQLTTSATYDLHMGLVLTSTDPNNVKATMTYDSMGRPLTSGTGSLPATNYTYTDSGNWSFKVCSPVQGSQTGCQNTILDGLGRTKTTQLLDGSSTLYSATDTQYDSLGRAYKSSNPYTSSPAYWTQLGFDVLGRLTSTTLPDNSVSSISYADNTGTTTDPSGKQRKSIADGLGRLTSVYEPDPSNNNSLTLQTSYTYNIFDELTGVTQASQARAYTYDALARLTSSTTPEAGMVCIGTVSGGACQANTGYDSWGNTIVRTDARGVVTNYIYDTLNRLVGVTYPTVPSGIAPMANDCKANGSSTNNAFVCFNYGTSAASYNDGRIVSMYDAVGSETYSYDQYGNVIQFAKAVGSTTFNTYYAYNLAGELTQITYPSGRAITQNLDTIGRLSSVVGTFNSVQTTYASGYLYNVAQQTTGFEYGNNLYSSFGFASDTLLLKCLDYSTTNRNGTCTNDSTTKFGLQYSYPASPGNNGRISGITDAVDNGRSATYTYDALYRLTAAVTTGSTNYPKWGLSETYDRYGNRTAQGVTAGTGPMSSVTVSTSTNRITGSPYAYDASGNMTNDGLNTLTYDGENRTTQAANGGTSGTYTYDGNGLRVKKASTVSGVTTNTVYIFSNSKVIAEYDYTTGSPSPSSPSREYIYSGGTLLAKIDSSGTKYYHRDQLSNRLATDSNGNTLAQIGHYPFGEAWYNASNDKLVFTSYERDAESGNDYAMARYYVSRVGRFSSPDPLSGAIVNPQSLNRYAYVGNDPINLRDPFGMDDCGDDENPCPDSDPGPTAGGGIASAGPTGDPMKDCGASACLCTSQGSTFLGCTPLDCSSPQVSCANQPSVSAWEPDIMSGSGSGNQGGGGGGGGPLDVNTLKARALVAFMKPDCAALFGGIGNALSALFSSTYNSYTPGQANPYPTRIDQADWKQQVNTLGPTGYAFSFWSSRRPGGSVFFTNHFSDLTAGLPETPGGSSQMTGFLHELEHVANHSHDVDAQIDGSDANYATDRLKINTNCGLKPMETQDSTLQNQLTPP